MGVGTAGGGEGTSGDARNAGMGTGAGEQVGETALSFRPENTHVADDKVGVGTTKICYNSETDRILKNAFDPKLPGIRL